MRIAASTNFTYNYQNGLNAADTAAAITRLNALEATCEADLATLQDLFGVSGGFGTSNQVAITIANLVGALGKNRHYDTDGETEITIVPFTGAADGDAAARAVFVAEMSEVMMDYRNQQTGTDTWNLSYSTGEALSTVCEAWLHPEGYYTGTVGGPKIGQWLNSLPRPNWVDNVDQSDKNFVTFGCGIAFIYYLHSQLGFSLRDIITKAGNTLEETYVNLTGQRDGWTGFIDLLNVHLPVGANYAPNTDNLFPLPNLSAFFSPNQITCGYQAPTQVFIDRAYPVLPLDISLFSANPSIVSVPPVVTIPKGSMATQFSAYAFPIAGPFPPIFVKVYANYGGRTLNMTAEVVPPVVAGVGLSPDTVVCGDGSTGTVQLNVASLLGDVIVDLTCSAPGFATVHTPVRIPQGQSSATFPITTPNILIPFKTAHADILASYGGSSASAMVTVKPRVVAGILQSLALFPNPVKGGSPSRGTVTLEEPVPKDTMVGLAAVDTPTPTPQPGGSSSIASVPASVTIPAGQTSAVFSIYTKKVIPPPPQRTATISAAAVNVKYAMLTIQS